MAFSIWVLFGLSSFSMLMMIVFGLMEYLSSVNGGRTGEIEDRLESTEAKTRYRMTAAYTFLLWAATLLCFVGRDIF